MATCLTSISLPSPCVPSEPCSHKRMASLQSQATTATFLDHIPAVNLDSDDEDALDNAGSPRLQALTALFEYILPKEPLEPSVKNTFIDYPVARPDGWAACFEERRVRSAPGSVCHGSPRADPASDASISRPLPQQQQAIASRPKTRRGPTRASMTSAMVQALGSPEMPTVGSQAHDRGRCKPCAFSWKPEGCQGGVDCPFCHLCDSGEKTRRRKTKNEQRKSSSKLRDTKQEALLAA